MASFCRFLLIDIPGVRFRPGRRPLPSIPHVFVEGWGKVSWRASSTPVTVRSLEQRQKLSFVSAHPARRRPINPEGREAGVIGVGTMARPGMGVGPAIAAAGQGSSRDRTLPAKRACQRSPDSLCETVRLRPVRGVNRTGTGSRLCSRPARRFARGHWGRRLPPTGGLTTLPPPCFFAVRRRGASSCGISPSDEVAADRMIAGQKRTRGGSLAPEVAAQARRGHLSLAGLRKDGLPSPPRLRGLLTVQRDDWQNGGGRCRRRP